MWSRRHSYVTAVAVISLNRWDSVIRRKSLVPLDVRIKKSNTDDYFYWILSLKILFKAECRCLWSGVIKSPCWVIYLLNSLSNYTRCHIRSFIYQLCVHIGSCIKRARTFLGIKQHSWSVGSLSVRICTYFGLLFRILCVCSCRSSYPTEDVWLWAI